MDELARFLLEHTNDALLLIDSSGRLLGASRKACELYGYSQDELLHCTMAELVSVENLETLAQALNQATAKNGDLVSLVARHRDGGLFPVSININRFVADDQELVLVRLRQPSVEGPEQTQLHAQLEEMVQEVQALYRVTSFLISADNLGELVEQIVDVLHQEFGLPDCDVVLLEEATGRLIDYGSRGRYRKASLRVDGPGLIPLAVRTGDVVNVPDVHAHQDYLMGTPETRSELVVPLKTEGKVIGALNLESPHLGAFSQRDVRVLTSFANRAALAIRQAQLNEQLRRRAEREMLINKISRRLQQSLEVEETLQQAVRELGASLNVDRCLYYGVDAQSGQVSLLHEYLRDGVAPSLPSYQVAQFGPLADLARAEQPLVFDDLRADPRTQPLYDAVFRPVGARSMLCVPLFNKGQPEGALALTMVSGPRHWTAEEVELSLAVATQVAIARRQAKLYQRLRQSEEMYRSIFENAKEGIFQTTPDDRFLAANPALARMLGYDRPEELLALDIAHDLWVDGAARQQYKREIERQGRVENFEIALKKRDGSVITVKENARTVRDAQGRVLYYEGTLEDVTQQKQAEKELRQRNQELSTLYTIAMAISRDPSVTSILHNSLFELTRVLDVPFGCIYVKQDQKLVLQSYRGFLTEEVKRLEAFDLSQHPGWEQVKLVCEPVSQSTGQIAPWEKERGIQAWVSVPMRSKKAVIGVIRLASQDEGHFTPTTISLISGVANQVAMALENARLYEQMKASEEKYRSIFENVMVGLYRSSPEGKVLSANPALVRMLGYESLDELLAADIPHDLYVDLADRENNLEILRRTGQLEGVEYRLRRKDGQEIVVLEHARAVTGAKGRVLYFEGTLMDVTEKKALERQLLQAQKMESIGTLAGGIAHDFNNLLTGILGYTSLLLGQSQPGDRHYRQLLVIEESARRAAELTEQLLALSRQTITQLRPTDLNAVLDETMTLLRGSLDASIEIDVEKEAGLWTIQADARHIQQVLMNLCVNARDAMPQGGSLKIETANVTLDEEEARSHVEARPGRFVVLRVSDTGEGIAPEDLPRIFDPFFSTKEVNQGTGLGLSTAYGIVKSHNGFIQVESQPGQGTRFSIYFPAVAKSITASAPGRVEPEMEPGVILVVDDEEIVRQLAKAILEREGYRVVTAPGGQEALQIYQQRASEIRLVILDLTMPKMSGRVCYQELRKLDPHVRVMLSSGYSADEAIQDLLGQGVVKFLQKPYRVEDLTQAVRDVLHSV